MIVSRCWLEALLGRPLDAAQAAHLLTMRCAAVDAVVPVHQDLGDVLIARVLEVKKHPNADRLSLCLVDAGEAVGTSVEVVCGAPNVAAGKVYPFAPVGGVLPGGLKLDRRKIRGVESNGMLCSTKDLGLGDDHSGLLELDTTAAPGSRFVDVVPVADHQIVVDVTANRPDLLCHKGIARELGAALGVPVKLPEIRADGRIGGSADGQAIRPSDHPPIRQSARGVVDGVEVRLEDPEGAPRYMIAVIRGVRVGPSPAWLGDRLRAAGQRSINNVVDATNYVLLEINQPLHAFDLARLRGPAVVVRRARAGERIVTLDGVARTLSAEMTAICDAERPTIIAGVMGSAESEVSAATTDVVLECAYFQPTRIRRTRRAVGLSSESSYRFERGIDLLGMPDALRRAIDLIVAVAGGEVREAPLDLWPEPQQSRTVFVRPERVSRVLGLAFARPEIERLLGSVGFVAAPKDERIAVQVPGWRPDVSREVDLIEEVARLKGYDAFPDELRGYRPGTVPDAPLERAKARVREALARAGMLEARTIPLGAADGPDAVALANPLSAEEAHLPSRLLPSLVRRVEFNWTKRARDIRLFEVARVFRWKPGRPAGSTAREWLDERTAVAGVLTGARSPAHWSDGSKAPDMDLWDLKHHFALAVQAAVGGAQVRPAAAGAAGAGGAGGAAAAAWEAVSGDGRVVGWAGPLAADAPVWAGGLFGFEVAIDAAARPTVPYRVLPQTPAVERDLALVLPAGVRADAVEAVVRRVAGPLLERLEVFDEYRGAGLPAGARSVAWHCSFRDPARTLREADVDPLLTATLRALEDELDVRRREG